MEAFGKHPSSHTEAQYECFDGFSPAYLGAFD